MTAVDLLERLTVAQLTPAVENGELLLNGDPPLELEPILGLLFCPLLALLTGRRLFAVDQKGRGCVGLFGVIDPRQQLPEDARLICVEGLTDWDRISPLAIDTYPQCFKRFPKPKTRRGQLRGKE